MGNSEINPTISQNKGDETGQKTTIMAARDRKRTQQPTVKAERDKKIYNRMNVAGGGRRGMTARTQQSTEAEMMNFTMCYSYTVFIGSKCNE